MKEPKSTTPERPQPAPVDSPDPEQPSAAMDHYQREKARRARRTQPDSEAMASARREYRAMLEINAAKGRGGRPKKQATPITPVDDGAQENEPDLE
jgi:hypothetical protein